MRTSSRTLRPVMSGFCSEPESANSFSMILCVSTNHVCSWPVRIRCSSVPSVSKPGNSGTGSRRAGRVEPQRRRAGQDADAVHRPDRVPVADALHVVPHAVGVDDARRRRACAISMHAPVDVRGHAGDHVRRRPAEPLGPVAPHELVVAADAARRHDHGLGAQLERRRPRRGCSTGRARTRRAPAPCPPRRRRRRRSRSARSTRWRKRSSTRPRSLRLAHPAGERLDDAGAGSPGDVEARARSCRGRSRRSRRARPSRRSAAAARPARAATRASRRRRTST